MARKNRLADRRNGLQQVKLLAELSGHTIECACEIVEFIVAIHGDMSREIAGGEPRSLQNSGRVGVA